MPHFASTAFWAAYSALPPELRNLADRCYRLLEENPRHPSLHLKCVGLLWSVRVGSSHRAVGVNSPAGIVWIWIGTHADYERIIRS